MSEVLFEGKTFKIVHPATCDYCCKTDAECLELPKKVLGFIKVKSYICDTCLSEAFKHLKKDQ